MVKLGNKTLDRTFFIAEIGSNHDGDLKRAISLIQLAKSSGADAVKFQNFLAETIVSKTGFSNLKIAHQSNWKKPVYDVYKKSETPVEWTEALAYECRVQELEYFTSAYDLALLDKLDPYVNFWKLGSGDIDWIEMLHKIASKKKPILLGTGACTWEDVSNAVQEIRSVWAEAEIVLLQCNTNYTGVWENFEYLNLNVLTSYKNLFKLPTGLSDHTPGDVSALGAVALGARVIEKHFTDNRFREGPDHHFAMNPEEFYEMVQKCRLLEKALGTDIKKIEPNELASSVVQRRSIRVSITLEAGEVLTREVLNVLRPAPAGSISPRWLDKVVGKHLIERVEGGEPVTWEKLGE